MSLLHRTFFESVISINIYHPQANGFATIGTGFIFGKTVKGIHKRYLVTNRHVLENIDVFFVNFFDSSVVNKRYIKLEKRYKKVQYNRQGIDVAVVDLTVELNQIKEFDISCVPSEYSLTSKQMEENNIYEGSMLYVLGHPINISSSNRFFPICRIGSIAQISNIYRDQHHGEKSFLADCPVLPGNSGGPIFLKPDAMSYKSMRTPKETYLIGIVNANIRYGDVSTDDLSKSENTGLSNVICVDYILDTIRQLEEGN